MPEIQSADVGRKLQERYNLDGAPPSPFLAPDVTPVVIVDDLTGIDSLEAAFERRYVARSAQTAPVAQRAQVKLMNPVGSGVLVTMGLIGLDVSVDSPVLVSEPIDLSNVITNAGRPTDGRVTGRGASGLRTSNTGGTGVGQLLLEATADDLNAAAFFGLGYILVAGQMCELTQQVTNETLSVTFFWTERNA